MAEPLRNSFGPAIPQRIARQITAVYPRFPAQPFLDDVLAGYEQLELLPRGKAIAHALHRHLPQSYPEAVAILLESIGPEPQRTAGDAMSSFFYLPHTHFVGEYGLLHFEESMHAQHVLTQRFTAEFSIRPFLLRHRDRTLAVLRQWAEDPSVHVRRLVSEGTRPRLPWAARLRPFQQDPMPVIELLELLKDDPELYVRRSVANNLNDIGKDNPDVLLATARRWIRGASPDREWVVRHALRSAVKAGDAAALAILGFAANADVAVESVQVEPDHAPIGSSVALHFVVRHTGSKPQRLLIDYRIHYVKASGRTSPKVFKLAVLDVEPDSRIELRRKVSLKQLSTRTHYPGTHRVELLVNGVSLPAGEFHVTG